MSAEKYLPDASAEGAGDGGEMETRWAGAADGAVERGDSPGASTSTSTGAGESEALLPRPVDDAGARAAAAESSRPMHAAPGDAEVPAYVPPGLQQQASPHGARARVAGAPMTILVKPVDDGAAAAAAEGAADEAPDDATEDAAKDAAGSPGVLDNLKAGVLGAVKGALVPGSVEEDTRNKAGTAAEGGAAAQGEQEEQEQQQQEEEEEEEESRCKMIAMTIATISK
eukprot:COSAG06_NODE_5197_length_3644_cov_25.138926_3_plen_227_part_00